MADLKLPELNNVMIVGNLTKDPIFRKTTTSTPVVNFTIASNRRYRDSNNLWQEDVCFIGIVAWNKLAESCSQWLKKGCAVFVEGELQSRNITTDDGFNKNIVEIKAKRIQFLNKKEQEVEILIGSSANDESINITENDSFDKFLTEEESQILKD